MGRLMALSLLLHALCCCCVGARARPVVVRLAEGLISGYISHSNTSSVQHVPLATFLGVPYGESTEGDGRWSPPRPKGSWSETRNASDFAAACPGGTMSGNISDPRIFSEDCLFANVWTPISALSSNGELLPVVVWVHGGGYFMGTANDPVWWGHQWAARGVVFVSFEYRLGALGFFHSSSEQNATNFGLLDQLLLLQWVQRNAHAFGGNASKVTLMGQSSGAMSVLLLSTMPAAYHPTPLFSRAIACSPVGLHYRTIQEARVNMETFARSLACSERDLVCGFPTNRNMCATEFVLTLSFSCLRKKSVHQILSVQLLDYIHLLNDGYDNFLPWLPLIAPDIQGGLLSNPLEAFRSGEFHQIPIIIGSVMNETEAWIPKSLNDTVEVELMAQAFFGHNSSSILQLYDEHPPYARFGALLTDALVTCYVRHVARLISRASPGRVRLYTHMHPPSARADPTNYRHYECTHGATCHAGDNVFTFASYNGIASVSFTQYEQELSDHVVETLVSFVRGSVPSWWPVYSAETDMSLQWGVNGELDGSTTAYHSRTCDFWDGLGYQE